MKLKYLMFNLKSNMNLKEILEYKEFLKKQDFKNYNFVLFPAIVYIPFFYNTNITIGVQNISLYETGAITDTITLDQITSLKVKYTLLNHSDVNENLNTIVKKIKLAFKNNIKVVLILGEKEKAATSDVIFYLQEQIKIIFSSLTKEEIKNLVITYEPSWLINQSFSINIDDLQEIINNIKKTINSEYEVDLHLCYGGSVNETNIKMLNKVKNLDGFLIGNSAKNPENVVKFMTNL